RRFRDNLHKVSTGDLDVMITTGGMGPEMIWLKRCLLKLVGRCLVRFAEWLEIPDCFFCCRLGELIMMKGHWLSFILLIGCKGDFGGVAENLHLL
ncbi:MAG: hypothetical protein WBB23_04895, partial [Desulforhopalus sp.]